MGNGVRFRSRLYRCACTLTDMAENMTKMSEEDKAQLATIRRAEKLLAQDEDLARRIGDGESIDQAGAESTAAFGPESHSE